MATEQPNRKELNNLQHYSIDELARHFQNSDDPVIKLFCDKLVGGGDALSETERYLRESEIEVSDLQDVVNEKDEEIRDLELRIDELEAAA